ncbi:Beta-parvin [Chelonia mydas]|uniref:Beta-parvin n=1 Tax=Chelonia mydas TaxID=8469 RepID=M7BPR0_CHEMY|nr:Beta-parvin [Chelonia mydas]
MMERGHDRDTLQCRDKVKELRNAYHKAHEANSRSGAAPATCRFYKELDPILGGETPPPLQVPWTLQSPVKQGRRRRRKAGARVLRRRGDSPASRDVCSQSCFQARRKVASCSGRGLGEDKHQRRFMCVHVMALTRHFPSQWPEENEERTMIDPNSKEDSKFKELIKVLIDWINDVLVEERIIVKQLEEDLYDGQVLQKLLEKLADRKLNVAEVTQSEIGQKQKLQTVLEAVHDLLRPHGWTIKWNVDSIHGKNLISILHLLVALAMHFRAPIRLPEHVSVQVVVVRVKRDAFDTLFDHAPDKLSVVKKSLITFVNKHLNKLNLEVTELETQFADGVYLVLLMGLLEDYFVPLHNFYLTPESFDQKVSRNSNLDSARYHIPRAIFHPLAEFSSCPIKPKYSISFLSKAVAKVHSL